MMPTSSELFELILSNNCGDFVEKACDIIIGQPDAIYYHDQFNKYPIHVASLSGLIKIITKILSVDPKQVKIVKYHPKVPFIFFSRLLKNYTNKNKDFIILIPR